MLYRVCTYNLFNIIVTVQYFPVAFHYFLQVFIFFGGAKKQGKTLYHVTMVTFWILDEIRHTGLNLFPRETKAKCSAHAHTQILRVEPIKSKYIFHLFLTLTDSRISNFNRTSSFPLFSATLLHLTNDLHAFNNLAKHYMSIIKPFSLKILR